MDVQPEATPEESVASERDEPFLQDLDGKLVPFRRVLVYAVHSNKDVRFFEHSAGRWIDAALKLKLPNAIREALSLLRHTLAGIDDIEPTERRERLVELHQHLVRLDRSLGLPLKPKAPRKPKKRGLMDNQEEEDKPPKDSAAEAGPSKAAAGAVSDEDLTGDALLVEDDGPLAPRRGGPKPKKDDQAAAKVLWDRRPGVELSTLDIDAGLSEALQKHGVLTTTDLFLLKPTKRVRIKPIRGAGRPLPAGQVAISGRVIWRRTAVQPDGSSVTEACIKGASNQLFRWTEAMPWYTWEDLSPGSKVILLGVHIPVELQEAEVVASTEAPDDGDGQDVSPEDAPSEDAASETELEAGSEQDAEAEAPGEEDDDAGQAPAKGVEVTSSNGIVVNAEVACDDGKNGVRLAQYGLEGVPDRAIRGLLYAMLACRHKLRDWLPGNIVKRQQLLALHEAVCSVHGMGQHHPNAEQRFVFEEALLGQLGGALSRYQANKERGIPHTILHSFACQATRFWGQDLTDEQQLVLEDIKRDLRRASPMRRVITGEVGAGKSLVALTALSVVAESLKKKMFLAQSRLYSEASFVFIEPLLRELGLVGRVLKGPPTDAVRDAITRGELHVLFATHEDLAEPIEFRRLGLVVAEEATDWGTINEYIDTFQAPHPDVLVNTVRPLPVVALLGPYAKFDISFIESSERQPVEGVIVDSEQRMAAYAEAATVLAKNEQVCVVFPSSPTTGEDLLDAREALQLVKALEAEAFEGGRVSLFHGKMSRDERLRVYDDFTRYRSDVLVATHPIEAAPPAPRVTVVVVEQAELWSTERLQRVQGQLSKSMSPSRLIFVVGPDCTAADRERLEAVIAQKSGVELAELSLIETEPADTESIPSFVWFQPTNDRGILLEARGEVHRMLQADPWLKRGGLADVSRTLVQRWGRFWDADLYPCTIQASTEQQGGSGRRRRRRRRKN
jgi:ATP-dependent DNA helicase RecG